MMMMGSTPGQGRKGLGLNDESLGQAPDGDVWWYVCTIRNCNRAFIGDTRLRTHKWNVHSSKGFVNVLILSEAMDLSPVLRIERCSCSSSPNTEGNFSSNEPANPWKLEQVTDSAKEVDDADVMEFVDVKPEPRQPTEAEGGSSGSENELLTSGDSEYEPDCKIESEDEVECKLPPHRTRPAKECVCDICGKPCLDSAHMYSHKLTHRAPSISCPECGKLFKSKKGLDAHMRTHGGIRKFKCGECDFRFHYMKDLKKHQARHRAERPFQCSECPDKAFKLKNDLSLPVYHYHRPHLCRALLCGQEFAGKLLRDRHELQVHELSSSQSYRYPCEFEGCVEGFASQSQLSSHASAVHGDGRRPCICENCGQGFWTGLRLRRHLLTHMPSEERAHLCDFEGCGKRFPIASLLRKHNRLAHHGIASCRPTPCRVCGKEFKTKSYTIQHELRVHNFQRGEGEWKECKTCGKKFGALHFLQKHEVSHGGERPCVCETCGKGFKDRVSLKQHEVIHEEQLAHVCEVCGKGFKVKRILAQHMATHVPYEELQHVCDVCDGRFGRTSLLREHKERMHGAAGAGAKKRKRKADREEESVQVG